MKVTLFALFTALLMVGFVNSESKPDLTDTAPKKDRMKDAVEWSKLQNRNGDTYIPNTEKPFSGWAKQTYDNGQVKVLAEFTDGSVTRLKQWQENGIPRWDIGYSKGRVSPSDVPLEDWRDSNTSLQHGLNTIWYENGQKIGQVNFKKGKQEGIFTVWYESGKIKRIGNYKDGKIDGVLTRWREDNGQKEYEANYKDGKLDGLETEWWGKGKKESEKNYKDGKKHGLETSWYFIGQKAYENIYKEGKLMFAKVWKPNGEKCPVTNVQNGNGLWILYDGYDNENMEEMFRYTYKDGEDVRD
jgi:antitoxin component YwqK of YwqJK toxin-antitoxin module